jgi:hypothetical protein
VRFSAASTEGYVSIHDFTMEKDGSDFKEEF